MDIRSFFRPKQGGGSKSSPKGVIDGSKPKTNVNAAKSKKKSQSERADRKASPDKGIRKTTTEKKTAAAMSGVIKSATEIVVEIKEDVEIVEPRVVLSEQTLGGGAKRKASAVTTHRSSTQTRKKPAGWRGTAGTETARGRKYVDGSEDYSANEDESFIEADNRSGEEGKGVDDYDDDDHGDEELDGEPSSHKRKVSARETKRKGSKVEKRKKSKGSNEGHTADDTTLDGGEECEGHMSSTYFQDKKSSGLPKAGGRSMVERARITENDYDDCIAQNVNSKGEESSKSQKKQSGGSATATPSKTAKTPQVTPSKSKGATVQRVKGLDDAQQAGGKAEISKPSSVRKGGGGGFNPSWRGGDRKQPPMAGQKEMPKGADQCLKGNCFVVSGVLDSLRREEAEDLIKQYGGKVTQAVSGKTDFLLLGSVLDDGRAPEEGSKYRNAQKHKTKIIDEDKLFLMINESNTEGEGGGGGGGADQGSGVKTPARPQAVNPYGSIPKKTPAPGSAGQKNVVNPYGSFNTKNAVAASNPQSAPAKSKGKVASGSAQPASKGPCDEAGQQWVDKYKPRALEDLIGHGGQVKKLKVWLENWDLWHLRKTSKPPTGKDNPGARAALLSGPPGVGKSSTAGLVARELGYHVTELNASDTRNKRSLESELSTVIGNQVLRFDSAKGGSGGGGRGSGNAAGAGGQRKGFRHQLVVMDEVDGMGGADRGGIGELILLIKKSKVPIIAICNDRQAQKIRSLVNHCYDLRFSRPQKATIIKRAKAVAAREGLEIEDNAAEMLVEANGNDIRQVLHALQMWSRKSSKMTYTGMKGSLSTIEKDKMLRVGPFEGARMILGSASRSSLRDRYEAFFTDYSLLPLLVHQNYLNSLVGVDKSIRAERTGDASAAVSDADMISGKMRGDVQHWELLPSQAALNVRVGSIGRGSLGYPDFPKWLGNYSKENKHRRLLSEVTTHLNSSISGGPEAVRLSYLPTLRVALTRPLLERGAEGAEECVSMLEEYGLSRDDLFEVLPELQLSNKGVRNPPLDVFAAIDTKTKTAVTRVYNSLSHKSQALVETMQAPKRSKKAKAPPKSLAMDGGMDEGMAVDDLLDEEEEEEEEEREDDLSAFRKKGRRASKGKCRASDKEGGKGTLKAKRGKKIG